MTATTTWAVRNLERIVETGAVVCVYWTCAAAQEDRVGRFQSYTDLQADPDDPDFIPFADLTEAQVLTWVHAQLGDEQSLIEAQVQRRAEAAADPDVLTGVPWGAS